MFPPVVGKTLLDAFCRLESGWFGTNAPIRDFICYRTWALQRERRAGYLARSLIDRSRAISGLGVGDKMALLQGGPTRGGVASRANVLQFKGSWQRLRGFYCHSDRRTAATIKVVVGEGTIAEGTRAEIDLRSKLTEGGTITVPRMIEAQDEGDFIMIVEDMVPGRRFQFWRDASLYLAEGLPQLLATYVHFGIRHEPLARFLEGGRATAATGLTTDREFAAALEAAMSANPVMPFGLCHGDLLPSNLCVSDGKLVFFDWEGCGEGPLIVDLMRLPFKYPGATQSVLSETLRQFVQTFDVSPEDVGHQFTAYVADRISMDPKREHLFLKAWRQGIQAVSA